MEKEPTARRVIERLFSEAEIKSLNARGYNVYFLPNYPSSLPEGRPVDGTDVDTFEFCFVDMDLKDKVYASKDEFIEAVAMAGVPPSRIVDSGGGVHVYWRVTDLDAMSYLRFQRRLTRVLNTDPAVGQIYQLMRLPGTMNTKKGKGAYVPCELLFEDDVAYTAEELNKLLPPITVEDEAYCQQHYDKTYNLERRNSVITDVMPPKFGKLLAENHEAKDLWSNSSGDRSKNDYRLGHLMYANGFTRDEAITVLANSAKALNRAPVHRLSYGENIVDKIWTFEAVEDKKSIGLSSSVKDILSRTAGEDQGRRFPCYRYIDDTQRGFRLGDVLGLVAGSGVGKTALALNLFRGFVASNPDYDHFFVSLEQPAREIAERWAAMCGDDHGLHEKVQIIDNFDENNVFRDLSLETIKNYILEYKVSSGRKVGCVVIDHIGVLANDNKLGQDEGVKKLCKAMKAFALETDTFLIMQSQTSREKAGIGDLELNKDAAFGTSVFENFCDYLVTMWQPLKRAYNRGAPTVMALKFAKIRHKKQGKDRIHEDVCYQMFFDPETERVREMTQAEEQAALFYNGIATNLRKQDRKTDIVPYQSRRVEEAPNVETKPVLASKTNDNRH